MKALSLSNGLSWRTVAVAFLILFGYGMKASVVDTAAVMSGSALSIANEVETGLWDTTPPTATSLRIVNGGGTNNRPDPGDVITIGFSEPIDLGSIKSGWDGTATAVAVTIDDNNKSYGNYDIVTFDVNLGVIDLGDGGYTSKPNTSLSGTMEWNDRQTRVEITLGSYTKDKARTIKSRTDATFYPDASIQDTGRIAIDASVAPTKTDRHF